MFEELFKNKTLNTHSLLQYGFVKDNNVYKYSVPIMDQQFILNISIDDGGQVSHNLVDTLTNDPYVLYLMPDSTGEFVGSVRQAISDKLFDISTKCYYKDIFKAKQTKQLIEYVRTKYNAELEFLWEDTDGAIWRNKANKKWFGLIMKINISKLGLEDKIAEIIDIRIQPEVLQQIRDDQKFFAGYHMNKKSWLTMVLDNSVPLNKIKDLIDNSFKLSSLKK